MGDSNQCRHCRAEMFPRRNYCPHCGASMRTALVECARGLLASLTGMLVLPVALLGAFGVCVGPLETAGPAGPAQRVGAALLGLLLLALTGGLMWLTVALMRPPKPDLDAW